MGKPKLRSTIKALFSFRPAGTKTMTWVCVQQAKTDSFREVYKSFNSVYYSSSSTTTSELCSLNEETEPVGSNHTPSTQPSGEDSFSTCCSSSSSTESTEEQPAELIVKGFISSTRFFFSPCTTKSIMEEASAPEEEAGEELSLQETAISSDRCDEAGEVGGECMIMDMGFCRGSVTLAMSSQNPYMDFRISMEEMVAAHGLRDWSCLQELLHCYLTLNEQTTHKIIILAFVDVMMNLITLDESDDENNESTNKTITTSSSRNSKIIINNVMNNDRCFRLPLCLDV